MRPLQLPSAEQAPAARQVKRSPVAKVDRSRGADGVVDKTTTRPNGSTVTVDRSRNADGTINATVTRTPPPAVQPPQ